MKHQWLENLEAKQENKKNEKFTNGTLSK